MAGFRGGIQFCVVWEYLEVVVRPFRPSNRQQADICTFEMGQKGLSMAISGPFGPFLVSMEARSKQRAASSGEREARSAKREAHQRI